MTPEFIDKCILDASNNQSKCSSQVLNIQGMSGIMTRHLYNNICSLSNINYLEIGCNRGSSTISALYKNDMAKATIIDNWSEFGGPKVEFENNVSEFLPNHNITILHEDSFNLQTTITDKFYIYLYDGHHSVDSHKNAITHFWNNLSDHCIIMVDDYNWDMAKEGTLKGLEEVNANIIYMKHVSIPDGQYGFWNGCGIFLIDKTKTQTKV